MSKISERLREHDARVGSPVAFEAANLLDEAEKALEASRIAIDDWLHQYAPEFCNEPAVTESMRRIRGSGGTLAYIVAVQAANCTTLARIRGEK